MDRATIVKVQRYLPKNKGIVHAVLWTGQADCLIGLPDLNKIMTAVKEIDSYKILNLTTDIPEGLSRARPLRDFVVVNSLGGLEVWTDEFMQKYYSLALEVGIAEEASNG